MPFDVERDLGIDVLVIGGGIAALSIARALYPQYSVCVVSEPGVPYESYESAGRFCAGYTGNDVARMQAAGRAAGFWRRWARSHGVPTGPGPALHLLRPERENATTARWAAAGLDFSRVEPGALPPVLAEGVAARRRVHHAGDEVVMDPARVAAELRSGIEDRVVAARVERFGLITPLAVDIVELALDDGQIIRVAPRFVVLASDVANASLLHRLAIAFKDRARRRVAAVAARQSQAVARRPTIVVRGRLPLLTAHIDGIDITTLPPDGRGGAGGEVVWLVQLPIDHSLTTVGPEDVRFPPPVDHKVMSDGLDRLFELCPDVRRQASRLRWSMFVARRTGPPTDGLGDPSRVPRPAPARLDTMGMEALVAAWPSQVANSMMVGDVVAGRVRAALGGPEPEVDRWPDGLPRPATASQQNRWDRADLPPLSWSQLVERLGYHDH
jgi:hypothetical protein